MTFKENKITLANCKSLDAWLGLISYSDPLAEYEADAYRKKLTEKQRLQHAISAFVIKRA
ncbi:MAG: hypothetical protein E5V63_03960 [Mesorhizobium sp.]|nr:MAG: hypothetical protein E5V63_03960 [Mesorhizobium sp.]